MQNIIDSGFTLYIRKSDDGFIGTGLKKLERGIQPLEVEKEKLNILEQFPAISKKLDNNKVLQIWHSHFCYFFQLGKTVKEGPYGEKDCFEIMCEGVSPDFQNAIVNLEAEASRLEECTHQFPLIKAYRDYGSDKYEYRA